MHLFEIASQVIFEASPCVLATSVENREKKYRSLLSSSILSFFGRVQSNRYTVTVYIVLVAYEIQLGKEACMYGRQTKEIKQSRFLLFVSLGKVNLI